jgi:hypothetical protein
MESDHARNQSQMVFGLKRSETGGLCGKHKTLRDSLRVVKSRTPVPL